MKQRGMVISCRDPISMYCVMHELTTLVDNDFSIVNDYGSNIDDNGTKIQTGDVIRIVHDEVAQDDMTTTCVDHSLMYIV